MADSGKTTNAEILKFIAETEQLCKPDKIVWAVGGEEEFDRMCQVLVDAGTFTKLNPELRPDSYLARSDPSDVARVESRTYICSHEKDDAGPTNNWRCPVEMKNELNGLFDGCMKGRTMYVIPFCMGPVGSPYSRYGVQLTDSAYVVVNMQIMTRMGDEALKAIGDGTFVKCLHSVGAPLAPGQEDVPWPCNSTKYICHFPDEPSIMSFGSGYGGNALLGKKCYALRIASTMGKQQGWMAEHCLIMCLQPPEGEKIYIAAAFPSACGKTNLAMLVPSLPGWKVTTVGDDIAWFHLGSEGEMRAINPERGFFGVAPGTNDHTNKSAMETISRHSIFTNVALTPEGDVWWEGMTKEAPEKLIDWTNKEWTPGCGRLAAHPNSRYTTPAGQCPVIDSEWESDKGVKIDAILFGGRRSATVPLVTEAKDWKHGVYMGAVCSSEQTAAAEGKVGALRMDPFAMLPFCGYHIGDYIQHWLDMGAKFGSNAPHIYFVNWFRKGADGKFLWPGFSENSRVLKWICDRVQGRASVRDLAIGGVPSREDLDLSGLDVDPEVIDQVLTIDRDNCLADTEQFRAHFDKIGEKCPKEMYEVLDQIQADLKNM